MNQKLILNALILAVAAGLSACGKNIPSSYQGYFEDKAQGAKLSLDVAKGEVILKDGRKITATINDLKFDDLAGGKAGIYLRSVDNDPERSEVFWIMPNKSTRQEQSGYVWMEAELLYTRLNFKNSKNVKTITMTHCTNGQLNLDLVSKIWMEGCGTDEVEYRFVRSVE